MEKAQAKKIWQLIEPVVSHGGYEVAEVEVHGNRNAVVRIFLDGPSGITLETCVEFARTLSALFDVEDPFPGRYTLEVSSPGVERPLRTPAHFGRHLGKRISLKTTVEGVSQKFRGVLKAADDEGFLVDVEGGEERRVTYEALDKAHVLFDFAVPGQKKSLRARG